MSGIFSNTCPFVLYLSVLKIVFAQSLLISSILWHPVALPVLKQLVTPKANLAEKGLLIVALFKPKLYKVITL
jgi:hypothetical protein